jgi:hypothetical protein
MIDEQASSGNGSYIILVKFIKDMSTNNTTVFYNLEDLDLLQREELGFVCCAKGIIGSNVLSVEGGGQSYDSLGRSIRSEVI